MGGYGRSKLRGEGRIVAGATGKDGYDWDCYRDVRRHECEPSEQQMGRTYRIRAWNEPVMLMDEPAMLVRVVVERNQLE